MKKMTEFLLAVILVLCSGICSAIAESDAASSAKATAEEDEAWRQITLTLDFADLEYVSSAGLRVLLTAHTTMLKKSGMKLLHVNEEIMDSLAVTGLANVLNIEKE